MLLVRNGGLLTIKQSLLRTFVSSQVEKSFFFNYNYLFYSSQSTGFSVRKHGAFRGLPVTSQLKTHKAYIVSLFFSERQKKREQIAIHELT